MILRQQDKYLSLIHIFADAYNPMPDDGKKYKLVHNDGNLGNCQANNLEGKEVRKYDPLATRRKIGNGLTVTVEGKIFDKGKELPIEKETGDRDTAVSYTHLDVYKRQGKCPAPADATLLSADPYHRHAKSSS